MKKLFAVLITFGLTIVLLTGVKELPQFGVENTPMNNNVSKYYIENAAKETGAANIITGIILDYRAFDTFVEASVLFTSAITVIVVLRNKKVK